MRALLWNYENKWSHVVKTSVAWQDSSNNRPTPCNAGTLLRVSFSSRDSFCLSSSNNCRLLWFYAINNHRTAEDNTNQKSQTWTRLDQVNCANMWSWTLEYFLEVFLVGNFWWKHLGRKVVENIRWKIVGENILWKIFSGNLLVENVR